MVDKIAHRWYTIFTLNTSPNNMTTTIFNIIQFTLSALLITAILLQQKGTGLSGVFGGSSNIYSTKRGVDKVLHLGTVVISVVFFSASLIRLVL